MDVGRRLTSLGRAARAEAGVKVPPTARSSPRFLQPGSAFSTTGDPSKTNSTFDVLEYGTELVSLRFELVPNFRTVDRASVNGEGAETSSPAIDSARRQSAGACETVSVTVDGNLRTRDDDLELRVKSQGGFAVSRDGGEVIAWTRPGRRLLRRAIYANVVRQVRTCVEFGLGRRGPNVLYVSGRRRLGRWF